MYVYTTTDLMNAAATALAKRDSGAFDRLRQIKNNWLQAEDERAANDAAPGDAGSRLPARR